MKNYITPPHKETAAKANRNTGRAVVIAPHNSRPVELSDIGKKGNIKEKLRREIYRDALARYFAMPPDVDDATYKSRMTTLEMAEKGLMSLQKHNDDRDNKRGKAGKAKAKKSLAAGDYDDDLIELNAYLDKLDKGTFDKDVPGSDPDPGPGIDAGAEA